MKQISKQMRVTNPENYFKNGKSRKNPRSKGMVITFLCVMLGIALASCNRGQKGTFGYREDSNFATEEKAISAIEQLELVEYKTGFYEYRDRDHYELLYQPIVIMKWKNISDEPLVESIKMKAVFIDNKKDEEWSNTSRYFHDYSDAPLQAGLSRQLDITSSVGFTSYLGIENANISCQIFINDQFYKTVKIKNEYVSSNRLN